MFPHLIYLLGADTVDAQAGDLPGEGMLCRNWSVIGFRSPPLCARAVTDGVWRRDWVLMSRLWALYNASRFFRLRRGLIALESRYGHVLGEIDSACVRFAD